MAFVDQVRSRAMRAWRGVLGHIFPGKHWRVAVFHSSAAGCTVTVRGAHLL
jgi:hypothetical protein